MRVGSAVLVWQKEPSGGGARADDFEEVARHQPGEHALGRLRGAEAHHFGPELMGGERDEMRVPLAHLLEERIAEVVEPLAVRSRAADVDQRGRVGDADAGSQQERVGQAEDRRAGRDAHGQRQHRRQRENRAAGEQTKGIADVGSHGGIRLAAGGDCFIVDRPRRRRFSARSRGPWSRWPRGCSAGRGVYLLWRFRAGLIHVANRRAAEQVYSASDQLEAGWKETSARA